MKTKLLKELFADLTYTVAESCSISDEALSNMEIASVVSDGRELQKGCLFICCRDTNYNGPSYLAEAIEAGAAVIVTERAILEEAMTEDVADPPIFIFVDDARYAMAFIYAAWYDHPADKLLTIGITGTKGKTTTAYMLYEMLRSAAETCTGASVRTWGRSAQSLRTLPGPNREMWSCWQARGRKPIRTYEA